MTGDLERNVIELFHRPSSTVGLESERDGRSVLALMGLPDRDDHDLVVEVLVDLCADDPDEFRLDTP